MVEIERLKQDAQQGKITTDQLVDLIAKLQTKLQQALKRLEQLEQPPGGSNPAKVDEPFSMRAEELRQQTRGERKKRKPKSKKRRGRVSTAEKVKQAQRTEQVFPDGVDPGQCQLSHVRPVWRLENGRALLVAYHVYRGPGNRYGQIPGVLGRSEFGLEIVIEIAYLVYVVGLSFDKVCLLLNFFQQLRLGKSQADALLRRLARHWEKEFDALCVLLANSLVVHADETSWSLNSVWAYLSEKARILLFGVHKDADTMKLLLDPASFAGIVISDDAAVYGDFSRSQKCWAHLLRKAIKLTLQDPGNAEYRTFADRLLEIYREACRVQRDRRLGDAGRARRVGALEDEILFLCPSWALESGPLRGLRDDYRRLVNEVARLMIDEQLFVFVTAKPVEQPNGVSAGVAGTNNEAERTLRGAAEARKTGRTNKSPAGARRQTVVTSVLQSLRLYLSSFTLAGVMEEVGRWVETGRSCFVKLVLKLKLTGSNKSILDQVLPEPDG